MKKVLLLLSFSSSLTVFAQEIEQGETYSSSDFKNVEISSFAYPNYMNQEQHSTFLIDWSLNKKNSLMLNGNYDTNPLGDVFKSQLLFKRNLGKKFYVFSGFEISVERSLFNDASASPNYKMINGVGYEIQDNFRVELVNETIIGKQNFAGFGAGGLIKLATKYKF